MMMLSTARAHEQAALLVVTGSLSTTPPHAQAPATNYRLYVGAESADLIQRKPAVGAKPAARTAPKAAAVVNDFSTPEAGQSGLHVVPPPACSPTWEQPSNVFEIFDVSSGKSLAQLRSSTTVANRGGTVDVGQRAGGIALWKMEPAK